VTEEKGLDATPGSAPEAFEAGGPAPEAGPVPEAEPAPLSRSVPSLASKPALPPPSSHVEVARTHQTVIFRVIGLGNMRAAMGLMGFSEAMLEQGYSRFAFDLTECRGLDSTFMGAMVGLAADAAEHDGWVSVVNASEPNTELLQIVGADKFIRMRGDLHMEPIETTRLPEVTLKPQERLELVRRAHERLVEIDKRNEERFGSFLRQLTSDLSR